MGSYDEEQQFDSLEEEVPCKPKRDALGRFPEGVSGNPRGPKKKFKRDPSLPAAKRRIISAVADEEVEVKIGGKVRKMTMFEANVRALARDGITNRVAAQRFIELATGNSKRDLERRLVTHELREHLNRVEEENERLKRRISPNTGAIVLGAEAYEKWNAERWLDDEGGVAELLGDSPTKR